MQTVTSKLSDTADSFRHDQIKLAFNWGGEPLGTITLRTVEAGAHITIKNTEPEPWQAWRMTQALTPDEHAPNDQCTALATSGATLPEQMAYPLRTAVWHHKPPLHAQELASPWFSMVAAMAGAADEIKRATGHDMSADVQRAADTFTRAAAVPPDHEAELATMGYTACELAFATLCQACKDIGEAITMHRLGDGLSLCQASAAANQIVDNAVRFRTKSLHSTTH